MRLKNIKTGRIIEAKVCKRPKMTSHRGRTWDFFKIILNGEEKKCNIDTTWGFYGYFEHNNRWYKIRLNEVEEVADVNDIWSCSDKSKEFVEISK